jgi:hypothetical protein
MTVLDAERLAAALRAPAARVIGFTIGLVALGFLVARFVTMSPAEVAILQRQSVLLLATGLAAYCVFQGLTVLLLRPIVRGRAGPMWAAAQLVKYLPLPGSAMFGMIGRAVQEGHTPKRAFEFMARHTLLMVGGGITVGGPAVGMTAGRFVSGATVPVTVVVIVLGAVVSVLALGSSFGWGRRLLFAVGATGTWVLLGIAMWATAASGTGDPLLLTSAMAAAWVAGLLVLPVPAGIGIREAAILFLLAPDLGQESAIAFALITRVLHVLSDGIVALTILLWDRRTRPATAGSSEPRRGTEARPPTSGSQRAPEGS